MGYLEGASAIGNVSVNCSVTASGSDGTVGGFVGYCTISGSTGIEVSKAFGSVTGKTSVGGFVGSMNLCYVSASVAKTTVTVNTSSGYGGGFVGSIGASNVNDCVALGKVTGSGKLAGFAGSIQYFNITRCVAFNEVTGSQGAGFMYTNPSTNANGSINDSYAFNTVSSGYSFVGNTSLNPGLTHAFYNPAACGSCQPSPSGSQSGLSPLGVQSAATPPENISDATQFRQP